MKMITDHPQTERIARNNLIAADEADTVLTVIDGLPAIIAIGVCHLMGKHQILSQLDSVMFSLIIHGI